ncbi:MAG: hypothetical protein H3C35_02565 [Bacteroidetes bacterium]|nr:hypothetical protein [Bacteroidota bacterium]
MRFFTRNILKFCSAIVIVIIALAFVHSELGMFIPEHHTHILSDEYCRILDGATNQIQKTTHLTVEKKIAVAEICFHSVREFSLQLQRTGLQHARADYLSSLSLAEIYLTQRAFLI